MAISWGDAEQLGLKRCPYCHERKKLDDAEFAKKSFREQVDIIWGYYKNENPLTTFSHTVGFEPYLPDVHYPGQEIDIDLDDDGKAVMVFGLTEWGHVPKRIREFCREDYDTFKLFILDACEDEEENLKLKIGVYQRKLWAV